MALQLIDLGSEVTYIDIDAEKVPYTFSIKLTDKTFAKPAATGGKCSHQGGGTELEDVPEKKLTLGRCTVAGQS